MSEKTRSSPYPPRLFWRRLAAVFVDAVVSSVLVTALFLPFLFVLPGDRVMGDGIFRFNLLLCDVAEPDSLPAPETLPVFSVPPGTTIVSAQICASYRWGLLNGYETKARVVLPGEGGGEPAQVRLTYPSDRDGTFSFANDFPASIDGLLFALIAILATQGRRGATLGKRWLGLRVLTLAHDKLSVGMAVKRELWRSGPIVVMALMGLLDWGWRMTGSNSLAFALGLINVLFVVLLTVLIIWIIAGFLSFVRWRGAMVWDRAAGVQVVRAITASPEP